MRGLGLWFTNPVETGRVWDMCLCLGCSGVGAVGGVGVWLGSGRVVWCYVCCESILFV